MPSIPVDGASSSGHDREPKGIPDARPTRLISVAGVSRLRRAPRAVNPDIRRF